MNGNLLDDLLFLDEGAPAYTIRLDAFEGPLDLLLHLIKKNEIDIYNIPVASITRQYLDHLELMKELNLDVAGEFLVMASTLVQIKSRMLLPASPADDAGEEDEEDPRAELVRRLIEYQKYKDAAGRLAERVMLGRDVFARKFPPPQLPDFQVEEPVLEIELFDLIEAFQQVLAKVPIDTFHEVGGERVSVADRINAILELLQEREAVAFEELFADFLTREYLIATFLALLELCKLRLVKITQVASFSSIWITAAVASGEANVMEDEERGTPTAEIDT